MLRVFCSTLSPPCALVAILLLGSASSGQPLAEPTRSPATPSQSPTGSGALEATPVSSPEPASPPRPDAGPDVLPALDETETDSEVAPEPPPPPPPEPVVLVYDGRGGTGDRVLPVRRVRRLALLGEVGWNTLAGFGPNLTFHALPHLSFDLGAGLSLVGWKLGLRARYNFLETPVTPFVGAGLIGASGIDSELEIPDKTSDDKVNVRILPSGFFQAIVGIDWTSPRGFTMVSGLGYAWLLRDDNVEVITGEPTAEQRRAFRVLFRSGIVISTAVGYSFK